MVRADVQQTMNEGIVAVIQMFLVASTSHITQIFARNLTRIRFVKTVLFIVYPNLSHHVAKPEDQ